MLYFIYNNDELVGFKYNGNTYHYHKNLFGDVIGIYDSSNNEIVTYEYDSWGEPISVVDTSSIGLAIINPFRYRSYYYDEETKLYYLNSRYYNPVFGRFINADGIINSNSDFISGNLYQYVSNNPVNRIDVTGSSATAVAGASVGGLASAISSALLGALKITLVIAAVIAIGTVIEKNITDTKSKKTSNEKKDSKNDTHYIYGLYDNQGKAVYIGRTNDFDRRKREHKMNTTRSNYQMLELDTADSLEVAKITEQYYINKYMTLNTGIMGCNKRNEISPRSSKKDFYKSITPNKYDFSTFDSETYVGDGYCVLK